MSVGYCTNSTLREAQAAVIGLPAVVFPGEFGLLQTRFVREWPQHQLSSLRAVHPATAAPPSTPEQELPPARIGQMGWGGGRWVGRWGHRLIALHRPVQDGEPCQTLPFMGATDAEGEA